MEIFKLRNTSVGLFNVNEKSFVILSKNIFLFNDVGECVFHIEDMVANRSFWELLEFPNEKNKKLFNKIKKLNRI